MRVPREIFRAYDIRGRALGAGAPLTPRLAEAIGRAFAGMLRRDGRSARCAVGGDQRSSTAALQGALVAGLQRGGVDVVEVGLAPSPLVYWAGASLGAAAAVVTASHNPPEQNGVKLVWPSTLPLRPEEIQELADLIEAERFSTGRGGLEGWDPLAAYLESLAVDKEWFGARLEGLRVVVDPGNGVASLTGAAALEALGARVEVIHGELRAEPSHPADPQHAANVAELCAAVREGGAELGFAWDGDGDRLGVVDGLGRRAEPDRVMALLAREWLARRPGARIHVDVKTSQAVIEDIRAHGGEAVMGPVGHSLAKHAMEGQGIDFGGEPSCHYYARVASPSHITDDAVRAALGVARLCARGLAGEAGTLEEQLDAVPSRLASSEVQLACGDERKFAVAAQVAEALGRRMGIVGIDGARADYSAIEAGAWALVRASNTSAVLTVRFEARTVGGFEAVRGDLCGVLAGVGLDVGVLEGVGVGG